MNSISRCLAPWAKKAFVSALLLLGLAYSWASFVWVNPIFDNYQLDGEFLADGSCILRIPALALELQGRMENTRGLGTSTILFCHAPPDGDHPRWTFTLDQPTAGSGVVDGEYRGLVGSFFFVGTGHALDGWLCSHSVEWRGGTLHTSRDPEDGHLAVGTVTLKRGRRVRSCI